MPGVEWTSGSGILGKTWMGENVVAWCDEKGRVCVAEAYSLGIREAQHMR